MTFAHNNIGLVLCQDCLCIRPWTDERHMAEDRCDCGGEFCGCLGCECDIAKLRAGLRSGRVLGLADEADLPFWCEETGTRRPPPHPLLRFHPSTWF